MTTYDIHALAEEDTCYLTTTGRVSGRPHTIEIWFALAGQTLYLLAGGRENADWVRNVRHFPQVQVKISEMVFSGKARIIPASSEEDALARRLVFEKYTPRSSDDLRAWSRQSLPVAIDLDG